MRLNNLIISAQRLKLVYNTIRMKVVAKAVLIDSDGKYLLMCRSNHPSFGNDPDLPGGTLEDGEDPLETMLREVTEEIGVTLNPEHVVEVYAGQDYSAHRTKYHLYIARVAARPELTISWEHSSYDWVTHDEFVEQSRTAQDTYMHMVHDIMKTPT